MNEDEWEQELADSFARLYEHGRRDAIESIIKGFEGMAVQFPESTLTYADAAAFVREVAIGMMEHDFAEALSD